MKRNRSVLFLVSLFVPLILSAQAIPEDQASARQNEIKGDESLLQDQNKKKNTPSDFVEFDKAPEVVKQVQPDYPADAMQDKAEGTVWVKIWIDVAGKVVEADIAKSENDVFNKPAIKAARQWVFKPAVAKGEPVAVWVTIPFRFKLFEGKSPDVGTPVGKSDKQDAAGGETPPELIKQIHPKYPEEAKSKKLEGTVWLKINIDESGKPLDVSVVKSDAEVFEQPAVNAAKQWLFKPATKDGAAVPTTVTVPVKFKLAEGKPKK